MGTVEKFSFWWLLPQWEAEGISPLWFTVFVHCPLHPLALGHNVLPGFGLAVCFPPALAPAEQL